MERKAISPVISRKPKTTYEKKTVDGLAESEVRTSNVSEQPVHNNSLECKTITSTNKPQRTVNIVYIFVSKRLLCMKNIDVAKAGLSPYTLKIVTKYCVSRF